MWNKKQLKKIQYRKETRKTLFERYLLSHLLIRTEIQKELEEAVELVVVNAPC